MAKPKLRIVREEHPVSDEAEKLTEAFFSSLSPKTREAYQSDIKDFSKFLELGSEQETTQFLLSKRPGEANLLVLNYRTQLFEKGLAPATINRRLAAIRSLTKLGRMVGVINWSIEIDNLKSETLRDTKGPQKDGFKKMIESLKSQGTPKSFRDLAICRLLHDRGLRVSEVVQLNIEDLRLDQNYILVLGKGRKQKERLTIAASTVVAIRQWIEVRASSSNAVFTSLDRARKGNGRLTRKSIWRMIKKLGEHVGLQTFPHGLRHLAITSALEKTEGNIRKVQKFSRHMDVRTIEKYDDNRSDLGGEMSEALAASVEDED